jgi:hypothetical protein
MAGVGKHGWQDPMQSADVAYRRFLVIFSINPGPNRRPVWGTMTRHERMFSDLHVLPNI